MDKFRSRLAAKIQSSVEETETGSSHPENWQTLLQSGKSTEEIRQDAIDLSDILKKWQCDVLRAEESFNLLTANSDKYLNLHIPIVTKGLSRKKLEAIATICTKIANFVTIV